MSRRWLAGRGGNRERQEVPFQPERRMDAAADPDRRSPWPTTAKPSPPPAARRLTVRLRGRGSIALRRRLTNGPSETIFVAALLTTRP